MTSHAMLIAEELEVDPRRIEIEHARADRAYDNPDADLGFQITGGSSSVRTSWKPLRQAGAAARSLPRSAAAATWAVPRSECVARDGARSRTPRAAAPCAMAKGGAAPRSSRCRRTCRSSRRRSFAGSASRSTGSTGP